MVDLTGDAREAREAERIFPPAAASDSLAASRPASTTREVWELRLALLSRNAREPPGSYRRPIASA